MDNLVVEIEANPGEDNTNQSYLSSRPASRRGIAVAQQPQPYDNNLVSFEQFFNLMRRKTQTSEDCNIVFERQEKNVSCFFFSPIFGN